VIALGALGFAGSLLLTGLLDGLLAARPRRLRRRVQPAPGWTFDPTGELVPAASVHGRTGHRAGRSLPDVDVATADH
jgi:hypothetical protein